MKIFAAVIEWPYALSDAEPGLILAHSESDRDEQIAADIQATANALTESDWREAIANTNSTAWRDWLDPLELTTYDQPFVSTYEREV